MKYLLVFPDIDILSFKVFDVQVDIVELVSYGGLCHIHYRRLFFLAEVIQKWPFENRYRVDCGVSRGAVVDDVF